jgi:DNA-binding FadR family transcriptional regulator
LSAAQADFEFHGGIVKATHNNFLIFLYEVLDYLLKRNQSERWVALLKFANRPKASVVAMRSHEVIYKSIVEGDEVKAEDFMREHFQAFECL